MVNKTLDTAGAAVEGTLDGAVMKLGGFGLAGQASELIDALIAQSARSLTFVNNNAGSGKTGLASLFKKNQVRKIGGRYTPQTDSPMFGALDHSGVQTLSLFRKVVWLNAFALLARVLVAFSPPQTLGRSSRFSPERFSQQAYGGARRKPCGWWRNGFGIRC